MKTELAFSNSINPGDVIAVGDVHANWSLYSKFLSWVKDSGAVVILLGDLIDRGGEESKVLDATSTLLQDPSQGGLESFYVLRGNHEQMFIDTASKLNSNFKHWMQNGGNIAEWDNMMKDHFHWISELPFFMTVGDTLFVHAGVHPGEDPSITLRNGGEQDLIWIRKPFIDVGPKLDRWTNKIKRVVHGHTITWYGDSQKSALPVIEEDRVNIDTGAVFPKGALTAFNVTQNTFQQFHNRIERISLPYKHA